jgi:Phage tail assembly chaperone proteins, E, or 41 or 14
MPEEEIKPVEEVKKVNGAEVSTDLVIPLRKKVIAHGEEIQELRFREPTAGDIEACGTPVMIDFLTGEQPKMTFETKAMFAMMSRLASVPPSAIKQLHPKDWGYAALALAHRFFIPEM